jgi:hypothetical protein
MFWAQVFNCHVFVFFKNCNNYKELYLFINKLTFY